MALQWRRACCSFKGFHPLPFKGFHPLSVIVRHASTAGVGKKHYERKLIQQPIETLYEVVSDVDRYKEFVPWCKNSKVIIKNGENMTAELEVGFNVFAEKYTSKIETSEPNYVKAISVETSIFEFLKTEWKFVPASDPSATWVIFQVNFQFRNSLYNEISKLFLQEVVAKMVTAFEQQCTVVRREKKRTVSMSA